MRTLYYGPYVQCTVHVVEVAVYTGTVVVGQSTAPLLGPPLGGMVRRPEVALKQGR